MGGVLGSVLIALSGCNNEILTKPEEHTVEIAHTSDVSKRIESLKEAGLLDSLLREQAGRSAAEAYPDDVDMDKLNFFIFNTDEALAEIARSENGDVQLRLIDALFTGGTVGEVADLMADVSEDMANEYLAAVETQLEVLYEFSGTQERSAFSKGDIRNIRLSFFDDGNVGATTRGAFAKNFATDTVVWYCGFCTATIAGVVAAKSVLPWISIPGIVAAAAGAGSMTAQLIIWRDCSPFASWVSALIGKNATALNQIARTGDGPALLTVTGFTVATVAVCAVSVVGRAAIAAFKSPWNAMVTRIINATGVNWNLFGIPFALIK
jgi:hypothetical protein